MHSQTKEPHHEIIHQNEACSFELSLLWGPEGPGLPTSFPLALTSLLCHQSQNYCWIFQNSTLEAMRNLLFRGESDLGILGEPVVDRDRKKILLGLPPQLLWDHSRFRSLPFLGFSGSSSQLFVIFPILESQHISLSHSLHILQDLSNRSSYTIFLRPFKYKVWSMLIPRLGRQRIEEK